MALVLSVKKYKEDIQPWGEGEATYNEAVKRLNEEDAGATEANLKGFLWRQQVGDGYAQYQVVKDMPGKSITLQWINEGDLWEAHPAILKSLTRDEVLAQFRFERLYFNGPKM